MPLYTYSRDDLEAYERAWVKMDHAARNPKARRVPAWPFALIFGIVVLACLLAV